MTDGQTDVRAIAYSALSVCYMLSHANKMLVWFQQTLMLDPRDRCSVADCLEHVAFETERLLNRNHSAAVGRQSRKQSATPVKEADVSRPASVIQCRTPCALVSVTPIPQERAELRSVTPLHNDVTDRRRDTPALQLSGSDSQTSDHTRLNHTHSTTEQSLTDVQPDTVSRFLRRKSKQADEETAIDPPPTSVLPAVDDTGQKESTLASTAATKKTYCVNLSGAAVHGYHRSKRNPTQMPYVSPAAVKSSPLTECKNKVSYHGPVAYIMLPSK